DDEIMFFTPTLVHLQKHGKQVYILCLSDNNYHQNEVVRTHELISSAKHFGINEDHISFAHFKDNDPWDKLQVQKSVQEIVATWQIDTIISFDKDGASGHHNHISSYQGILNGGTGSASYWYVLVSNDNRAKRDHKNLRYYLKSSDKAWYGMDRYPSQFTWYRKITLPRSRYAYRNILQQLK
ncbi:MAG: PIG-L family deacetylase, partial [Candidatus Roizmanbacteria bacterium]